MKIAIVYNRESQAVINLFGIPNKEKYGLNTISMVEAALVEQGHQVETFEGDKNIIRKLEEFMPRVVSGERPGLVFNLSYGIQGKGRYMHIPGILEMLGIPYVGSNPETHAIALDKVITKMILLQRGIPTPKFAVLETPKDELREDLTYPLIVKPKSEAVSFGLKIVRNPEELKAGVENIYNEFKAPTLVEEYIEGREVNVGLLGNDEVEALPPVELIFGEGEKIFTFEDKTHKSGRDVGRECPANLTPELEEKVKTLAIRTFKALDCYDSARVDFRIDEAGNPYVLEVNSMASLAPTASYVYAAEKVGLPYNKLVQRLIEVASKRYFGSVLEGPGDGVQDYENSAFSFITQNRDNMENELRSWTNMYTATDDPVSKQAFIRKLDYRLRKLKLKKSTHYTDGKSSWFWTGKNGFQNGTVFVIPADIPGNRGAYPIPFRKEPENLYGEGIASSRAGLISVLKALDALKHLGRMDNANFGVFVYGDEGLGMRYSSEILKKIGKRAKNVVVMHPGYNENKVVNQRRGTIKLKLVIEGSSLRIGSQSTASNALDFLLDKSVDIKKIDKENKYLTVAIQDIQSSRYSMLIPHRVSANMFITYIDEEQAKKVETRVRKLFQTKKKGIKTYIEKLEERPPMVKSKDSERLIAELKEISEKWKIPFDVESTLLPSAAGVVSKECAVVCGMAPSSKNLYTPEESISRTELVQKTLLISQFLLKE